MTKRRTDHWEVLLDDTTPGPWMVHSDDDITEVLGYDREGRAGIYPVIDTYDFRDAPLIAAAPEAVAEVVRLRRELEELAHGAYVMASQHYCTGGKRYDDLGSTEQSYYEALTRILEGGNDD